MHINYQRMHEPAANMSSLPPFSKITMPAPPPKLRNRLTLKNKSLLCTFAQTVHGGRLPTQVEVARWATSEFNLPRPLSTKAVANTLKAASKLQGLHEPHLARKTFVPTSIQARDNMIMPKFRAMEEVVESINGDAVKELARAVLPVISATRGKPLTYSNGWLQALQRRCGVSLKRKHGEAASIDDEAARQGRDKMRRLTDAYARSDIYNMDETAFYFRQEAVTTLSTKKKVAGKKKNKDRLTLALAVNADGTDKLPPLYIGTAAVPRPLKGRDVVSELGVFYTNSKKGWMNSNIFINWLLVLDLRMRMEKRHVLLLVDNVSSHKRPAFPLTNVRLEFLPKNQTARLQPLDQGVIKVAKGKYSNIKVRDSVTRFLHGSPQERIDVWTALEWSKRAFDDVSAETIQNCWRHADILTDRSRISGVLNY
jgi:hypothetical protein